MRVATQSLYDNITADLSNISEELIQANKVVVTGKRINSLSDDPVGLNMVLDLRSALSNIEQLSRNISMGRTWLNSAESVLNTVSDLVVNAKTLCIQMSTATTGSDERHSAAVTVENLLEELKSLANTNISGRYIFSGSKTDTSPFEIDGVYNGDSNPFSVKVGKNTNVEVGRDGQTVFGTAGAADDMFKTLTDLKTALESDDISGIQGQMDRLDNHFDHINTTISDTGQKEIRFDIRERIINDLNLAHTERMSKIEDADMVHAIMELKAKEMSYQAALAAAAKTMQLSLIDYI